MRKSHRDAGEGGQDEVSGVKDSCFLKGSNHGLSVSSGATHLFLKGLRFLLLFRREWYIRKSYLVAKESFFGQ